jgi:TonB family protein
MECHFSLTACRFALTAIISLLWVTPLALSQVVGSVNCSDCASIPKPITLPKPVYPPKARELNISGKVEVRIVIGEKGNVIEAEVLTGEEMLWEAAKSAALKAVYEPALSVGQPRRPVKVFGQITYNFVIEDTVAHDRRPVPKLAIVNGSATFLPKPVYPKVPIDVCASGKVNVEVLIGENGRVRKARAISGNWLFRNSAVNAARRARFRFHGHAPRMQRSGIVAYNFPPSKGCR